MIKESTSFYSDGFWLDASLYFPEGRNIDPNMPVILICSGYLGLKEIHPERFARALTQLGYVCFSFDYRGFGKSEGVHGRVLLQEQVRDIENAATYLAAHSELKSCPLILIGWGMGAGLVVEAAEEIPKLKGLVAVNGFYNGERFQREVRGEEGWRNFNLWVHKKRIEEVYSGKTQKVDPFCVYPLDPITKKYVDEELQQYAAFGGEVELHFFYSLVHFRPENHVEHLADIPLLVAHAEDNKLHPPAEAQHLYERYPGPIELYLIPHAGHTEWMCDDCDPFQNLVQHRF